MESYWDDLASMNIALGETMQNTLETNLEKQGYFVALCKGWEAAAKVITEYLTMGGEEG